MMTLTVPVIGSRGDHVTVQFDEFGELEGSVTRLLDRGFNLGIDATDDERTKLASKIDWFEKHRNHELPDVRQHKRIVPRQPISTLILPDGSTRKCFVIDMSPSGAAVSVDIVPEIGTPLAVGKIIGRVLRHFHTGFAVHFIAPQNLESLERMLIKPKLSAVGTHRRTFRR